jgi:hypothetical protein
MRHQFGFPHNLGAQDRLRSSIRWPGFLEVEKHKIEIKLMFSRTFP